MADLTATFGPGGFKASIVSIMPAYPVMPDQGVDVNRTGVTR
jgi:hypothetical protein